MDIIKKLEEVQSQFTALQEYIANALTVCDGQQFLKDKWSYADGGGGQSMVLEQGNVFEKAGVNFSAIEGSALPPAATAKRPELANCKFYATGVSIVIHPNNPFIPTSHANVRFFIAETKKGPVWWFGGGFDLTPYYGFDEDCIYWHKQAKAVCDKYGSAIYRQFKETCDDYFYLKHRDEHRGIGGLFFDDFNELDFEQCFDLTKDIGKTFIDSYLPIANKRKDEKYTQQQRDFQCYRRGRYAEFNMVYDRGTIFGLQSGGRTESILMSLPPVVYWQYGKTFEAGTPEHKLTDYYLKPQDWVNK